MRIKVRLSAKSIKQAQKDLQKYRSEVNRRITRFVKALADKGVVVARAKFNAAAYDGTKDVSVSVDQDGSHARIIASGETVLFIEFGTGTTYPEHPSGMFAHGTYGKGYGDSTKYPNGWAYRGEPGTGGKPIPGREGIYRTKGNPPAEAMWDATTKMAEAIEQTWREVMS